MPDLIIGFFVGFGTAAICSIVGLAIAAYRIH